MQNQPFITLNLPEFDPNYDYENEFREREFLLNPEIRVKEVTTYGFVVLEFTHEMIVPDNIELPGADIFTIEILSWH